MSFLKVYHSKCCGNNPKYLITYSCGFEPEQTLYVCEIHYQKESFQKYIKSNEVLQN